MHPHDLIFGQAANGMCTTRWQPKTHDVSEHNHLVGVLGKDGFVQDRVDVLMVPLGEKPHRFDVPAHEYDGADQNCMDGARRIASVRAAAPLSA